MEEFVVAKCWTERGLTCCLALCTIAMIVARRHSKWTHSHFFPPFPLLSSIPTSFLHSHFSPPFPHPPPLSSHPHTLPPSSHTLTQKIQGLWLSMLHWFKMSGITSSSRIYSNTEKRGYEILWNNVLLWFCSQITERVEVYIKLCRIIKITRLLKHRVQYCHRLWNVTKYYAWFYQAN